MPAMSPSPAPLATDSSPVAGYVLAVVGTAVAVLVASIAERWVGLVDVSLIFMLAVIVVAARTHTGPALLTAVLCFFALNFFFIAPRYTLYIDARHGVVTVVLFLAAALLAGRLASRLAMQVQALRLANLHASARQALAGRLSVAANEAEVVGAAEGVFREGLGAEAWVRLGASSEARRTESVEEHGWWFLPLRASQETLGVVGLKFPVAAGRLDMRQRETARAMADDVAQALLRTRLVGELEAARVANETERLRSSLLSSVSHDLRTPLASIIGAAGSLESYGDAMDDADRRSLLDAIRTEGERLDRYIQNLLDMTRLGHGDLVLHRDWIGVDELIGAATGRLQRQQRSVRFDLHVEPGLEPIWVHPALVEQALFNVLENAAKFSPPGAPIAVDAGATPDGGVRIDIADQGPGIPDDERSRIFDRFYSVARGDRGRDGTGLGLAICRGMIGAHGGDVEALPGPDDRGTTIRITLPLVVPPERAP
jgi:two-component system sensor histidine kinase KdpD